MSFLKTMGVDEGIASEAMSKAYMESTAAWCNSNNYRYTLHPAGNGKVMIGIDGQREPVRSGGRSNRKPGPDVEPECT